MRTAEWIQIGFAALLAAAAWLQALSRHPLPARRRWKITLLALAPITAVTLVRSTASVLPAPYVLAIREWLTAALLLVPYWQTGEFFQGPNLRIQERLMASDQLLLPRVAASDGTSRTGLGLSLELAYLFCYPLVPLGLLALYAGGRRQCVAGFWLVVLVSTYLCYAVTPFVPAYPPRVLVAAPAASARPAGRVRLLNRWVLQHGSIHAISFPSAHVASTLAVSLALLKCMPVAGVVFLLVSLWIAIGAVVGRYHYALDVLLGALVSLAVFAALYRFF
ncbi:MAG TPA: phosphatase PAP2 family protein [Acidobacteriaceae bacterium]|nr:phosphatase PAP2 family protein [Acidobacteriaceae bacterium]